VTTDEKKKKRKEMEKEKEKCFFSHKTKTMTCEKKIGEKNHFIDTLQSYVSPHKDKLNKNMSSSQTGIIMLDLEELPVCSKCSGPKILNPFGICVECTVMCACKKEGIIFLDGCCFCADCFKCQFMRTCCQRLTYPNDTRICPCSLAMS
jgi:hypothetical protein